MKVSIIGCGLIGRKRAAALEKGDELVACCDVNSAIGKKFAEDFNCKYFNNHNDLNNSTKNDVIIISVVNKFIKEIVADILTNQKIHLLIEKPYGRNFVESLEMNNLAQKIGVKIKIGFNHRFHPAILEAKNRIIEGKVGKILSIRAYYGHGGRPGMENEWRASKELCGGGELLDQGVHVIDLIRWFGGDIFSVYGQVETKFWNIEVEDNAFVILNTDKNVTAIFNVSWTNWKNTFLFEIFGTEGYIKIKGLGRSYGKETLEIGIRNIKGGAPEIFREEFSDKDLSWQSEWRHFKNALKNNDKIIGSGLDGMKANQIIQAIYRSSDNKKVVEIGQLS